MPFFRVMDIVVILLLIVIISYTYIIKNNSHRLNKEETYICKQIEKEENALDQLKIEWSYVTSPYYINSILQKYKDLNLEPIKPKNIVTIDSLPQRAENN